MTGKEVLPSFDTWILAAALKLAEASCYNCSPSRQGLGGWQPGGGHGLVSDRL